MDHVAISNNLHSNPLNLQLKAIGSRTIRERLSEAVTLRQKNKKVVDNIVFFEKEEAEVERRISKEEMVISSTMNSKWKSSSSDGPHNWNSSLNGGGDFQDQPLDFSSKTKKRRFSSSSSSSSSSEEVAATKCATLSKYDVVKVKTKEELISTKSSVLSSVVEDAHHHHHQKMRLKEQYLQLLRPEVSHHTSYSAGNVFPTTRRSVGSHDGQPDVTHGMPPGVVAGMAQFGGLSLGSESSSGHLYEGNHHTRVTRPFKNYVRDTQVPSGTLPMGYYGLPSQHPFMSMHFQSGSGADPSTLDSFPNSLMDRTYSTESYAEFRRQVLSLHQTMNGSTKRSSLDGVQTFSPHSRPMPPYGHHPRSNHHSINIESLDHNFTPSSPLLNPASSPSSFSSSVSPSSSPRGSNKKVNPTTTSGGSSGESMVTSRNMVCPSPTSSCASSSDSKVPTSMQATNAFASSENFSDSVHLHRSLNGSTSSTSSVDGVSNGDGHCKRRGRSLPEELKDDAYWERRRKNNEAAKRSRDARRAKEDEIAIRAAFLEQENLKLRVEVASLKSETAKLRCLLYNS